MSHMILIVEKYHSEGIFDQTGGELHIPSYGLTLSIPPGALPEGSGETITLDVLTDVPPEITLRHDETLVTDGFRCLPSGIQFVSGKPVKLKIPHCANLIDPNKVQVVLYSMNHVCVTGYQLRCDQPLTNMAFMAIQTGFSTDIRSTLDEMVPGSNTDLSNAEEIRSEDFIIKEMNTDQYYHLGIALGLSYQKLDSIQFRCRQHEEAGVYTPNQKAVITMIRYWKCLQHSVSLADDHLREVWKSVSESGAPDLASVLKQRRGVGKNALNFETQLKSS
eukprot:XP_011680617.1 PREDICTED: uncharacterized protein LOC105446028 [Strongylocentrotus purpuratus]